MGIVKRAADLAFTFRFLRMLVMDWKKWDAYKLGIIDENGKRIKEVKLDTNEKKSAFTPFIRLAANVKRTVGFNKLTSIAAALYLIKEHNQLGDKDIDKILDGLDIDPTDLIKEQNEWFVLEDNRLSPGIYKVKYPKVINTTYEEVVSAKDKIKVDNTAYPIGQIYGLDIYEAVHLLSNQKVYVTPGELIK